MGVRMIAAPSGAAGSSMCVTLVYNPSHVTVCESHGVVGAHVEQHGFTVSRVQRVTRVSRLAHSAAFLSLGLPSEFSVSLLFFSFFLSFPLASFHRARVSATRTTRPSIRRDAGQCASGAADSG